MHAQSAPGGECGSARATRSMVHPLIEARLARQRGTVASWQARADGVSPDAIRHAVAQLRTIHDGVHASGHEELTQLQRWWAATLTAPGTVLAYASAGAFHGFYDDPPSFVVVVRAGNGGPRQFGPLLVCRSATLAGDVEWYDGLPVTSPARTVLDLVAQLSRSRADRTVREALRVGAVDDEALLRIVIRHAGRRGVARLRAFAAEYSGLPATRCRSDPELLGLALLRNAGVALPQVNVKIAGHEADYSWPQHRRIVELDGPDFHRHPTHDLRIQRRWERAGWSVGRLPTGDIYSHPTRLLELAPPPG